MTEQTPRTSTFEQGQCRTWLDQVRELDIDEALAPVDAVDREATLAEKETLLEGLEAAINDGEPGIISLLTSLRYGAASIPNQQEAVRKQFLGLWDVYQLSKKLPPSDL